MKPKDSNMRRWGFLAIIILLLFRSLTVAQSERPSRLPIFLTNLEIVTAERIDLPAREIRQQYRMRVFTPRLQNAIREKVLEELRNRGYYFAKVDSQAVYIDSQKRNAAMTLYVHPGDPLLLHSVTISNIDSLSPEVKTGIADRLSEFSGEIYTSVLTRELFRRIINVFENHGYPLARLTTEKFDFRRGEANTWLLNLILHAIPGDSVEIAYLRFPNQKNNLTPYLQRTLRFHPGQRYEEHRISRYQQILRRQEFIRRVEKPQLARDKDRKYFLNIVFEEAPSTSFDGIIGYIPPSTANPDEQGYFTGLLNIGVRNLFGGGRKFQVFWQKQDRFSEEFRLTYREPFVLGMPFHTKVGMNRLVRDTTFIEWQYSLQVELPVNDALSAFAIVKKRSVVPDSLASRQLRLVRTEEVTTESGIRWDNRDHPRNPRRGVLLEMAFSLGNQKNKGPRYLLVEDSLPSSVTVKKLRIELNVFLPTFRDQLISNRLNLHFVDNSVRILRSPDQIWFGGATSVRGFREAQFFGKRVVWLNTEYRFLLGPQARFFLFTDNAYFTRDFPDNVEKWLTSYGLGLRFPGPLGIIQVDFGLEKGTPFREGKLHFRVINEF